MFPIISRTSVGHIPAKRPCIFPTQEGMSDGPCNDEGRLWLMRYSPLEGKEGHPDMGVSMMYTPIHGDFHYIHPICTSSLIMTAVALSCTYPVHSVGMHELLRGFPWRELHVAPVLHLALRLPKTTRITAQEQHLPHCLRAAEPPHALTKPASPPELARI